MEDKSRGNILIVDDEKNMCDYLSIILEKEGFSVSASNQAKEALSMLESHPFDLVIADVKMKGMDGIEMLGRIKKIDPDIPVVIMTAYSTWDMAVEAMRLGAQDFIKKPFENRIIKEAATRLVEYSTQKNRVSVKGKDAIFHHAQIVGNSEIMDRIFSDIEAARKTEATILITGESGVGKELAARALHYGSMRRDENFISINCSALVSTLLESEIFGHVKGAFTGADRDKQGLLEVAGDGTFFLDEIGDMDIKLQGKILKVLEDREFYPVGSTQKKFTNVRFIAATNQDLTRLIEHKKFRKDLFYRINVLPIHIPPLRERKEDIPLLAGHFLNKYSKRYSKEIRTFSQDALEAIARYTWPGNVRELENCIQRAIITTQTNDITKKDLPAFLRGKESESGSEIYIEPYPGFNLEEHLLNLEKEYIEKALAACNQNITKAAERLGISFRSIRYKIKKYDIKSEN